MNDEIINDYKSGVKVKDISAKYDLSAMSIYNIIKKAGVERNRDFGNKVSRDVIKSILIKYFRMHRLQEDIAVEMSISIVTVRNYIKKYKNTVFEKGIEQLLKDWDN